MGTRDCIERKPSIAICSACDVAGSFCMISAPVQGDIEPKERRSISMDPPQDLPSHCVLMPTLLIPDISRGYWTFANSEEAVVVYNQISRLFDPNLGKYADNGFGRQRLAKTYAE